MGDGIADKYWSPDGTENLGAEKKSRSPRIPSTGLSNRTSQEKRQEITGNRKLPANLSFRKST